MRLPFFVLIFMLLEIESFAQSFHLETRPIAAVTAPSLSFQCFKDKKHGLYTTYTRSFADFAFNPGLSPYTFNQSHKIELGVIIVNGKFNYYQAGLYYAQGLRNYSTEDCSKNGKHFEYGFLDFGLVSAYSWNLSRKKEQIKKTGIDLFFFLRGGVAARFKNGWETFHRKCLVAGKYEENYNALAARPIFSLGFRLRLNLLKE